MYDRSSADVLYEEIIQTTSNLEEKNWKQAESDQVFPHLQPNWSTVLRVPTWTSHCERTWLLVGYLQNESDLPLHHLFNIRLGLTATRGKFAHMPQETSSGNHSEVRHLIAIKISSIKKISLNKNQLKRFSRFFTSLWLWKILYPGWFGKFRSFQSKSYILARWSIKADKYFQLLFIFM